MAEEASEEQISKGPPFLVIALITLVIILISVIISMYSSYTIAKSVVNRPVESKEDVFEEEAGTEKILPLSSGSKDGSYMAYIKMGAEQTGLSLQIGIAVGVSKETLIEHLTAAQAPMTDRMLAYFSEKTKEDIIYSFQRKLLGEEIKEILNTILDKDLKIPKMTGRITSVHVTKLLFISL